jgi:hypothetical protein
MAKKYKGSLTLDWFNKQKAIINLDENSIKGYIETVCRYKRLNDVYVDKAKRHSLEQLYKDMLNLNPKKRIKLKDIISRINI